MERVEMGSELNRKWGNWLNDTNKVFSKNGMPNSPYDGRSAWKMLKTR